MKKAFTIIAVVIFSKMSYAQNIQGEFGHCRYQTNPSTPYSMACVKVTALCQDLFSQKV